MGQIEFISAPRATSLTRVAIVLSGLISRCTRMFRIKTYSWHCAIFNHRVLLFQLRCGERGWCGRRGGRALPPRGGLAVHRARPAGHAAAPRVLPLPLRLRLRNVAQVYVKEQLNRQRKVRFYDTLRTNSLVPSLQPSQWRMKYACHALTQAPDMIRTQYYSNMSQQCVRHVHCSGRSKRLTHHSWFEYNHFSQRYEAGLRRTQYHFYIIVRWDLISSTRGAYFASSPNTQQANERSLTMHKFTWVTSLVKYEVWCIQRLILYCRFNQNHEPLTHPSLILKT